MRQACVSLHHRCNAKRHSWELDGEGTEIDGDSLLQLWWKAADYKDFKENGNMFAVLGISHLNLIFPHAEHKVFCVVIFLRAFSRLLGFYSSIGSSCCGWWCENRCYDVQASGLENRILGMNEKGLHWPTLSINIQRNMQGNWMFWVGE